MAGKRKSMSATQRFEIFKRDGFKCMYCGAHPPDVKLHVDHIVAVAKGGGNDVDNLITSCERCNLGKGVRDLTAAPQSLAEKAADIREREAQLKGFYDAMNAQRQRIESELWEVIHVFDEKAKEFSREWCLSIKKFIEKLGFFEVVDAMEIARAKKPYNENWRWKYFCSVCWTKIRDREKGEKPNG
jgi:hypothetical protein